MTPPAFIESPQRALMGKADVIGFGSPEFAVHLIDREKANAIIRANHYSRSVFPNSLEHFGVFIGGALVGALQWGQAMNPASGGGVVEGTKPEHWRELNRMWLDDCAPRNSESRAISYSITALRRMNPAIAWLQSFADERCGCLGVVYQACSFLFVGEHVSEFYELDGEWYHKIAATVRSEKELRTRKGAAYLQANMHRAIRHELRQFRYIRTLKPWAARGLKLKPLPYPKHAEQDSTESRPESIGEGGGRFPGSAPSAEVVA